MKPLSPFWKSAAFFLTLLVGWAMSQPACGADDENPGAITPQRIDALPTAERAAWQAYYDRSQNHLRQDKATLAAEVKAAGLKAPLAAPGTNNFGAFSSARKSPTSWFASEEARQMADVCLSFQTPSGGWAKGVAYDKGLRHPAMHWTTKSENWYYVGTFDNSAFIGNMTSLAKIYTATKEPKYVAAFLKGLDYAFDAQFPNGGWPQNYPLVGSYHDEITYNDGAMVNTLEVLHDITTGDNPDYAFVDAPHRAKAKNALVAGIDCVLKTQIVENGTLTAWCAQHDPLTLQPAPARKFEIASLSGWESANIARFLMSIEPPTPAIKTAVKSAVAWFEKSKITGFEVVSGLNSVGGRTYALKPNPVAPPLWARFYELGTNRPVFVTREVKISYSLSEFDQSGPMSGYNWYVTQPQSLLERDYPAWAAKWDIPQAVVPVQAVVPLQAAMQKETETTPTPIKIKIVLAGDSTVTDNAGWGAGFKAQLQPEVELTNLSKGGRSSGSFVKEGRWKQTLELKPDYVMIQFGHNDQPGHGDRETDPQTTYRANMERYVDEAKAAGITPILVTSLSRRQWGPDGKIRSTLLPYVEVVKEIAAKKGVPLIDLHALSIAEYEKMGPQGTLEISPLKNADPNSKNSDTAAAQNQGYDGTHLNAKGGALFGKIIADALRQAVPALAAYLKP